MQKEVYTIREAAAMVGIAPQELKQAIDSGMLESETLQNTGAIIIRHISLMKYMKTMKKDAFSLDLVEDKKVLIVEDEINFANILKLQIERDKRFTAKIATNGKDARLVAHAFKPDIIILDFMLPDTTGETLLQTVRDEHQNENLKVIVYSSHTIDAINRIPDLLDKLNRLGANEFINKGTGIRNIINKVYDMLEIDRPQTIKIKRNKF